MKKIFGKAIRRLKFNSSRIYLARFVEKISNDSKSGDIILDAGAGDGRYARYFEHVQYESADICKLERPYSEITYVCNLNNIPVEDNRFDAIVCTQVLEHINDPAEVLAEFNRILKPNGKLYLTAPLYYPEHETPYDFFRYTQFGFQHLFKEASFEIESINWLEGYYMTLATQLWIGYESINIIDRKLGLLNILFTPIALLMKLTFPLLSYFLAKLDLVSKVTDRGHCKNYIVIASKSS